jgi:hypothetical protein
MSRYHVQITFEAPGLRSSMMQKTHSLPGRGASMRMYGSEGMLAVSAVVHAESPADAAMAVTREVGKHWTKAAGPLRLISWRAHRERSLAGLGRRGSGSWGASLPWDGGSGPDDEGGGLAGVREPRRPLPGPGSLHAALDLPGPETPL